MATYDCSACSDLQDVSSTFIRNGVTNTVCTSLKNNTGINPNHTPVRTDCQDLDLINDCLVGRMADEVPSYDVCDWKTFMKKFIPNVWTTIKALICAICGLWTKVTGFEDQIADICRLVEAVNKNPGKRYGTLLNTVGDEHPDRRGGTIVEKNGKPILVPDPSVVSPMVSWDNQNAGLWWGKLDTTGCSDGACIEYEWFMPDFVGYKFNDDINLQNGDIIWYVDKATALGWGFSNYLWNAFTISSFTWHDFFLSNGTFGAFQIHIGATPSELMGPDYMCIVYRGSSYPNNVPDDSVISNPPTSDRLYTHSC